MNIETIITIFQFMLPWEFSLLSVVFFGSMFWAYCRGLSVEAQQGIHTSLAKKIGFFTGLTLAYIVFHTRFDYYAQYMFFMHRLQHLVMHHLAPFLIALATPWQTIWQGLPQGLQQQLARSRYNRIFVLFYRVLQQPLVAMVLFVGLIYFWLNPDIHFYAMLSLPLYHLMNWSMWIDGLLFWWLMLNPHQNQGVAVMAFSWRLLVLVLVMVPQILLGAYISFADGMLYDVYAICGRAWPIAPETDQQIGGLITWIPATMMSIVGALIVIRFIMRADSEKT